MGTEELARGVSRGDRRSLARAITLVENDPEAADSLLASLPGRKNGAFVLGITGPPGTGKSTMVDRLIQSYRAKGLKVGVVAIDPTSPITGGALLGDRIRMARHATDEGVFIRSMASRGWSGGLTRSTAQVIQLMDRAGADVVLVETAGIGQSDIEVVGVAHAVVVVLMPGLGDIIQVSKAGLMEIADVYAVNKSDLEGAEAMVVNVLSLVRYTKKVNPPSVVKLSALKGEGVDRLFESIERLRAGLRERGDEMRCKSIRSVVIELARGRVLDEFSRTAASATEKLVQDVLAGRMSVGEAADALARRQRPPRRRGFRHRRSRGT
jgi:LAO/AO transport system kinase